MEDLSAGVYFRAARDDPQMRLRARLDEFLKAHYKEVTMQFKSYLERPFYEKLEKLLKPY